MKSFVLKAAMALAVTELMCFSVYARQERDSVQNAYSISVSAVFDHSRTFANQAGLDIAGHMPFNTYVEADAGFELVGPKILAGTLTVRPKLPVKVGELFLDASIHLRAFNSFGIGSFSLAASFGYRMDYVSVQIGVQRLLIQDFQKTSSNDGSSVQEPLNPILRLAFNVRPSISPWNLSLGASNFTLFQYERFYYPIFFVGGHFDFTNHLRAQAEVDFKPSGMFNMTTKFNELTIRAGLTYSF